MDLIGKYVLIGKGERGLFLGTLVAYDAVTAVAHVRDCRHVSYWCGKTGGITSLAAHGVCGPKADTSRIGAPVDFAILDEVRAVYQCSDEAIATFAAVVAK
jgi:hypothetical protein